MNEKRLQVATLHRNKHEAEDRMVEKIQNSVKGG